MKKTVRGLTIAAIVLMLVGVVMFGFTPKLMALSGVDVPFHSMDILKAFPSKFMSLFNPPLGLASWIVFALAGFVLILFIVHIIVICVNKRPSGLVIAFFFLLAGLGFSCLSVFVFLPDYLPAFKGVNFQGTIPFLSFLLGCYRNEGINFPIYWLIIVLAEVGVTALGFLFFVIADIADMVYLAQSPKAVKRDYAKDAAKADDVVIVRDDTASGPAPTPEEIRNIMHAEMNQASAKPAAAEAEYRGKASANAEPASVIPPSSTAISGPLLVQYINTYSPAKNEEPSGKRSSSVPLSEIQENVTGEKSLKAEDIRKIVKEELDSQKKESSSQPLIVTVPAPAKDAEKKEETKALSAEDIRSIIGEELKAHLASEKPEEPKEEPVIVEPIPEPKLSAEDIRSIIREELAAEKEAAEKKEAEAKAAKEAQEAREREIEEAKAQAAAQALAEAKRKEEEEKARQEAEARAEEARRNALTPEQIRQIIAEEFARIEEAKEAKEAKPEQPAALTAEDIRQIIADELKSKQPEAKNPTAPVTIIVREPLERKE